VLGTVLSGVSRADVRIVSTVSVCGPSSCDTLESITCLSGRWMRRELRGHGSLAALFGTSVRIIDRRSARAWTLNPEEKTFSVDTVSFVPCTPDALVDLRMLGNAHRKARTAVSLPDTTRQIFGVPARPVQIEVFPRNPERAPTRIRIWTTTALESLFGPGFAADLYCGGAPPAADSVPAAGLNWRAQFQLSGADLLLMAKGMAGYPILIESRFGSDTSVASITTIATVAIEHDPLAQDLFAPPPDYVETGNDSSNSARDEAPAPSGRPKR
jgi:hypothetical protein